MHLNEFVVKAHGMAKEKGWWNPAKSAPEVHMLIVTEIAEATEEVRKGSPAVYGDPGTKPEGEAIELADAMIRIADYFGYKGWDLEAAVKMKMKYNATRSNRHGGKRY